MLTLSENEIEKKRNTVNPDESNELFKNFATSSIPQPSVTLNKTVKNADVMEDKGWDDELDIKLE